MADFKLTLASIETAGLVLTQQCHGLAKQSGWWNDIRTGDILQKKREKGGNGYIHCQQVSNPKVNQ